MSKPNPIILATYPAPFCQYAIGVLPSERDYGIIGSDITGLSVAKALLERHPTATVTVLEARTLCSGRHGAMAVRWLTTLRGLRSGIWRRCKS